MSSWFGTVDEKPMAGPDTAKEKVNLASSQVKDQINNRNIVDGEASESSDSEEEKLICKRWLLLIDEEPVKLVKSEEVEIDVWAEANRIRESFLLSGEYKNVYIEPLLAKDSQKPTINIIGSNNFLAVSYERILSSVACVQVPDTAE